MPTPKTRVRGLPRRCRATLALWLAGVMLGLLAPRMVSAEGFGERAARAGELTYDAALLRPAGAAWLLFGSLFFVASVPFVAPFQGVDDSLDVFVWTPYEYLFERELGDF